MHFESITELLRWVIGRTGREGTTTGSGGGGAMAVRTRSISTCTMVAFGIGRERLEACNQLDWMHGVRRCDAGDQFDGSHRHFRQDFIPRGRVRRQGAAFRAAAQGVVDETFPLPPVSLRAKDERDAPRPEHSRGWDVEFFQ